MGKWRWEAELIARSSRRRIAGLDVPIPRKADLVLLKIAAGGPLDLRDAEELMAHADSVSLAGELRALDLPDRLRVDVERFFDPPSR